MKKLHLVASLAALSYALLSAACSDSGGGSSSATGGVANGGNATTGGAPSGGSSANGGASTSGGAANAGSQGGGASSSGGAASGGSTNGGASAAGGSPASGGSANAGSGSGGAPTNGGSASAGGPSGGAASGGNTNAGAGGASEMHWVATWGTSNQVTEPRNLPVAGDDAKPYPENPGLAGNTVRQVVRVSIGGSQVRLRLSNLYGTAPVKFDSVHIAKWKGDGKIDTTTDKALSFASMPSVQIKNGEVATSDPIDFSVGALSDVAITFKVGSQSKEVTGHPGSRTNSYVQSGDAVAQETFASPIKTPHWYFIEGLDVMAEAKSATVVALGDSLTDGRGSTTDGNDRWTDALAKRLQADASTKHVAVVNAGIGGNQVLGSGLGPPAKARFDHDVLATPGVKWVIVFEGVNDIGNSTTDVSGALIEAFQEFVTKAKAKSVKAYGATITPFGGYTDYDKGDHQTQRTKVNNWIKMAGNFDAFFDFAKAVADPNSPEKLLMSYETLPASVGTDHLHLNPMGYKACADAVDLAAFK